MKRGSVTGTGHDASWPDASQRRASTSGTVEIIAVSQSTPQRELLFADAAARGYVVAAAHAPFPGVGHVERSGKAYAWAPLNYSGLQ